MTFQVLVPGNFGTDFEIGTRVANKITVRLATEAVQGITRFATAAEHITGTSVSLAATPKGVADRIAAAIAAIPGDKYLQGLYSYNSTTNVMTLVLSDNSHVDVDMTALVTDAVASISQAVLDAAAAANQSRIDAQTAATAATNALVNFRSKYVGAFSTDPVVDGNGNVLATGALYFNTVSNKLRVYKVGTGWTAYDQEALDTLVAMLAVYVGSRSSDPTVDGAGNALQVGALYFHTGTGKLRIYNGTVWTPYDAAAQAALVSLMAQYLGAKASDPTVDNFGSPLVVGALYFHTGTSKFRVWSGTVWNPYDVDVQAAVTAATTQAGIATSQAGSAAGSATTTNGYLTSVTAIAAQVAANLSSSQAAQAAVQTMAALTGLGSTLRAILLKTNITGAFPWDTSKDLDDKWRFDKSKSWRFGLSPNTTTANGMIVGPRLEAPRLIWVVTAQDFIYLFDGDDLLGNIWRAIPRNGPATNNAFWRALHNANGPIFAMDGMLAICAASTQVASAGLLLFDFAGDELWRVGFTANGGRGFNFQSRWDLLDLPVRLTTAQTFQINQAPNTVLTMGRLPFARRDPSRRGMPRPLIAASPVSNVFAVIRPDGVVSNGSNASAATSGLAFDEDGNLIVTSNASIRMLAPSVYMVPGWSTSVGQAVNTQIAYTQIVGGFKNAGRFFAGATTPGGLNVMYRDRQNFANSLWASVMPSNAGGSTGFMSPMSTQRLALADSSFNLAALTDVPFYTDDFSSYADTAALQAVWNVPVGCTIALVGGKMEITKNSAAATITNVGTAPIVINQGYILEIDYSVVSSTAGTIAIGAMLASSTASPQKTVLVGDTGTIQGGSIAAITGAAGRLGLNVGSTSTTAVIRISRIRVFNAAADRNMRVTTGDNNNSLMAVGSIQRSVLAANAEAAWLSGFGATNYLRQPPFSTTTAPLMTALGTADWVLNGIAQADPQLATNGDFATGSFASWSQVGGETATILNDVPGHNTVRLSATNFNNLATRSEIEQAITCVVGRTYQVRFSSPQTILGIAASSGIKYRVGTTSTGAETVAATAVGVFGMSSFTFVATATTHYIGFMPANTFSYLSDISFSLSAGDTGNATLWRNANVGGTGAAQRLFRDNTTGFLKFEVTDGTTTVTATGAISRYGADKFTWLAQRIGNTIELYVNGVLEASASIAALGTLTQADAVLWFGQHVNASADFWRGFIGQFRIGAGWSYLADSIALINSTDTQMMQPGAKINLLGSTSSTIKNVTYDVESDTIAVGTTLGANFFQFPLRTDYFQSSTASGNIIPTVGMSGYTPWSIGAQFNGNSAVSTVPNVWGGNGNMVGFTENNVTGGHYTSSQVLISPGLGTLTSIAIPIKAGSRGWAILNINNFSISAYVNLTTGAFGTIVGAGTAVGSFQLSDGTWVFQVSYTSVTGTSGFRVQAATGNGVSSYAGDNGASGPAIYVGDPVVMLSNTPLNASTFQYGLTRNDNAFVAANDNAWLFGTAVGVDIQMPAVQARDRILRPTTTPVYDGLNGRYQMWLNDATVTNIGNIPVPEGVSFGIEFDVSAKGGDTYRANLTANVSRAKGGSILLDLGTVSTTISGTVGGAIVALNGTDAICIRFTGKVATILNVGVIARITDIGFNQAV